VERWPVDIFFRGTERFKLLRCLGEGGMGVVYEALDREHDLRVALKTLRSVSPGDVVQLKNEFRALRDIEHPNLVSLDNLHEHGGHWFFTMELVEGCDFLTWVRMPGYSPENDTIPPGIAGYDEARLRAAFHQLAQALCAIHGAGKVHRDIKPSNVRVTDEGRVVLLDFGLVVDLASEDSDSAARLVGTSLYMAPEQAAASSRPGPEADWYSFGVMLYEALCGQLPFQGPSLGVLLQKQTQVPRAPSTLVPATPAYLNALCMQLLSVSPAGRPSPVEVLRCFAPPGQASRPPVEAARPAAASSSFGPRQPFVGRDVELARLAGAFEQTRQGRQASVVVRGPSGVGKSALTREFTTTLRADFPEALILTGRCYDRESVPYKAFDGAIDALSRFLRRLEPAEAARILGRDAGLVGRLFPAFALLPAVRRAELADHDVPNPQELRQRAFVALRAMLARAAESRPVVLVVDDFQWVDGDSVALLDELFRRPDAPPLLLLMTMRAVEVAGVPADATRIDLGCLSESEARELVAQLARRFATSADTSALAREADGHPMFIQELVQHLAQVGETAGVARLEDALLSRLARLDRGARRLLEILALAGGPIALRVAALAASLSPAEAARGIAVLRVAVLTRSSGVHGDERVEVYHDRIREAVLSRLDEDTRRALHGRLAGALEAVDARLADPHALLAHLEAAGLTQRAAAQAERAAQLASQALAFDRAAMLYRTALRLGSHDGEARHRIQVSLGDALSHDGRCAEAAEAFFAAAEVALQVASRLECRRRAAEQLLWSGHVDRGLEELRAVLAEMKLALPGTPRAALYELFKVRTWLHLRGLGWTPRDKSQISHQDLEQLELHRAIGQGLCFADTVRGFVFHARGLVLALRAGEPAHVARALMMEAVFEGTDGVGRVPRARKLIAQGSEIADRTQDPYLLGYALVAGGVVEFFANRFAEAASKIEAGEHLFMDRTTGTAWEIDHARIFLLHCYLQMGRFVELGTCLESYLSEAMRRGDRFAATTMARSFNFMWLLRDDPARARRELDECDWSAPETGFMHLQHWFEIRALTELDLYEQRDATARGPALAAVSRSLLMRPQPVRIDFTWLCGRVALSGPNPDRAAAARAARRLAGEGIVSASVWALLLRAGLAAGSGKVESAVDLLKKTLELSLSGDMAMCAALARRRLGELLGGDEGRALVAQADGWLASQGIVRPERVSRLFAPGFPEP
jgi:hypothetical protein